MAALKLELRSKDSANRIHFSLSERFLLDVRERKLGQEKRKAAAAVSYFQWKCSAPSVQPGVSKRT
jgi:hypothetical protein